MEEMFAMTNSNTENAKITEKTSTKSANELKSSNDIFMQTVKYVSEISQKIADITEIAIRPIFYHNAALKRLVQVNREKGFCPVW